jgi:tRNA-binding EMAP/Myf-like protein
MALVEKNDNLKGKTVKMQDGMVLSWDDDDDIEEADLLELEHDDKLSEKKPLKTKDDDQKTKKVII